MNWAQENKKLAGIVGVMVAGAVGLGAWLFLSWSGYSASMEEWQSTQSRIATIKGKKLEPTDANVAVREKQLADYAFKVDTLRSALEGIQQKVKPMSETEFQAKLKDVATELKRSAKQANLKELPDDFALGFDKYAAQPPRSADIAAELNVHLDAMNELMMHCVKAGVTSIDSLERTKLANEDIPAPPKATPAPAKKSARTSSSKKSKKPVITEQAAAEPVLDRYPIKLTITTDQAPFQTLMNSLLRSEKGSGDDGQLHFMVVRLVRVENSRLDGPSKEEMNQKRTQQASRIEEPAKTAAAPAPEAAQLLPVAKPAPEDAFDIMGYEQLKVYLEIDYVRFRPAPVIEEEEVTEPAK